MILKLFALAYFNKKRKIATENVTKIGLNDLKAR